jgi:NADH dehydrogenase
MSSQIVIAGGGFGGFHCARALERSLPGERASITLVNDVNYMLWTPLLPGAAAGALESRHAVVPLREHLDRTEVRLGRVRAADPGRRVLEVTTIAGLDVEVRYDRLVVAVGSISKTLPVPGLQEHGLGLKTLAEGIALRDRLLRHLEIAETLDSADERAAYLTFVFVGGGYAGVEGLAELQDLAVDVLGEYPRCRQQGTRWLLVEAKERIMGEVHPRLAEYTAAELRARGVEVLTDTTVDEVHADRVVLSGGETVPARTLVWTAGVQPHPVVEQLGLPLDDGRIAVDRCCRVRGHDDVWALGDAAAVPDPADDGSACPPTAQHAVRQGRTVARNVAASLGTGTPKPFRYRTLGLFVDLGRRQAVAETLGVRWRGLPAWLLARAYHLSTLPSAKRRVRLLTDWLTDAVFGRDTIELGQVGHAPALGELQQGEQQAPTGRFARDRDGDPALSGSRRSGSGRSSRP